MNDMKTGLVQIWERRRPLIEQRLVAVERVAQDLANGRGDLHSQELAAEEAHKLAGSLGAFGLRQASSVARETEALLRNHAIDIAASSRLVDLTHSLRRLIDKGPEST